MQNNQQSDTGGANLPEMPETVLKAYRYHLRHLTAKEIGKLLDASPRTVQRWFEKYRFEELADIPTGEAAAETIQQKAAKMAKAGMSYTQIAKKLKRCKATIYNYCKAAKLAEMTKDVPN